jgi:hypothetical protein
MDRTKRSLQCVICHTQDGPIDAHMFTFTDYTPAHGTRCVGKKTLLVCQRCSAHPRFTTRLPDEGHHYMGGGFYWKRDGWDWLVRWAD